MSHDSSSDLLASMRRAASSILEIQVACSRRAPDLRKLDRLVRQALLDLAELRIAIRVVTLRRVKA